MCRQFIKYLQPHVYCVKFNSAFNSYATSEKLVREVETLQTCKNGICEPTGFVSSKSYGDGL